MKKIGLQDALAAFKIKQNDITYDNIILALLCELKKDVYFHIPLSQNFEDKEKFKLEPLMIQTKDNLLFSIVCTSKDKIQVDTSMILKTRIEDVLKDVASDQDVSGICINPWDKEQCFIPKKYIMNIIDIADGKKFDFET